MTSRAGRASASRASSETLHFDDPRAIQSLRGANDRHLALIEDALDVLVTAPGGVVTVTGAPSQRDAAKQVISALYADVAGGRDCEEADVRAAIARQRGLGRAAVDDDLVLRIGRRPPIAPRNAAQAAYLRALKTHSLVFGVGPAGTGKTHLAVAAGAAALVTGEVERLIVTRPAVEAGERLGYLPGDLMEKVDPYLLPIWDSLRSTLGPDQFEKRRDTGAIEVAPIAFMRGRTLTDAFVVIDEAQNATVMQMKMLLTRIGDRTRMAVTGDPSQVDLPQPQRSGLRHALSILDGVEDVAVVRFNRSDIVRPDLVARIVAAYDQDSATEADA